MKRAIFRASVKSFIKFNVICETPLDLRLINFSCYLIYSMTMNSLCFSETFLILRFQRVLNNLWNQQRKNERQTMAIRRQMRKKWASKMQCGNEITNRDTSVTIDIGCDGFIVWKKFVNLDDLANWHFRWKYSTRFSFCATMGNEHRDSTYKIETDAE